MDRAMLPFIAKEIAFWLKSSVSVQGSQDQQRLRNRKYKGIVGGSGVDIDVFSATAKIASE